MAVLDLVIAVILTYQAVRRGERGAMFNIIMHLVCMISCPYPTAEVEFTNNIIIGNLQPKAVYIHKVDER